MAFYCSLEIISGFIWKGWAYIGCVNVDVRRLLRCSIDVMSCLP